MPTKTSSTETTTSPKTSTEWKAAVSAAEFESDVVNVFVHYLRSIMWMTDAETAWAITKLPNTEDAALLYDPTLSAEDCGISFKVIKKTLFARAMQQVYDFAYLGIQHLGEDSLTYESIHTWLGCIVDDAANSATAREWESYGLQVLSSARQLLRVIETANARVILEGIAEHGFMHEDKDGRPLSVRQVALLSGMEEMSIRAAANPNRVNQLKPTKSESGTSFDIDVVKEWLIKKNRYIPVTRRWFLEDFDLSKSYRTWAEIHEGIETRYNLRGSQFGYEAMNKELSELSMQVFDQDGFFYIPKAFVQDNENMKRLAAILGLPEDLFLLRAQEAMAVEALSKVGQEIRRLAAKTS